MDIRRYRLYQLVSAKHQGWIYTLPHFQPTPILDPQVIGRWLYTHYNHSTHITAPIWGWLESQRSKWQWLIVYIHFIKLGFNSFTMPYPIISPLYHIISPLLPPLPQKNTAIRGHVRTWSILVYDGEELLRPLRLKWRIYAEYMHTYAYVCE